MPIVMRIEKNSPFKMPSRGLFAPKEKLEGIPVFDATVTPEEEWEGFNALDMNERTLYVFESIQFFDKELDDISAGLDQCSIEVSDHAKKIAWNIAATMQLEQDALECSRDIKALKAFVAVLVALLGLAVWLG